MLLQNPLKDDDSRIIKEIEGRYFLGDNELLLLTEGQKTITKTGATIILKVKKMEWSFFAI